MAVNRSLVLYPRFADHGVRRGAVYQSPPYNHTDAWRTLLRTHRNDIAAAMKIPPEDFRWYAAFHDKGNHPHVHMMAWSVNPNQAYLSKDGIRQIKSTLTNQIFRQELLHVYEQKSKSRDELVVAARKAMLELAKAMREMTCTLGHYDAGFTLRTYTHATRQKQDEAAQTMGSFMAQVM